MPHKHGLLCWLDLYHVRRRLKLLRNVDLVSRLASTSLFRAVVDDEAVLVRKVPRLTLDVRDVDNPTLLCKRRICKMFASSCTSLDLLDASKRLLLAALRAPLPVVPLDVAVQLAQILLDLELLTDFDREFHALLHLVQSLLLFHILVHLEGVALLLALYLLLDCRGLLDFLMCQDLRRTHRILNLNID